MISSRSYIFSLKKNFCIIQSFSQEYPAGQKGRKMYKTQFFRHYITDFLSGSPQQVS